MIWVLDQGLRFGIRIFALDWGPILGNYRLRMLLY